MPPGFCTPQVFYILGGIQAHAGITGFDQFMHLMRGNA